MGTKSGRGLWAAILHDLLADVTCEWGSRKSREPMDSYSTWSGVFCGWEVSICPKDVREWD